MTLGIVLLYGIRRGVFLMSEVPMYKPRISFGGLLTRTSSLSSSFLPSLELSDAKIYEP